MVQLLHDSSPPPGRGPVERGWSIEFLRTRASVAALAVAMVASALAPAANVAAAYDPATDMNSMFNTSLYTGARAWWAAGYTGAGVDVALIDTGVAPVAGLDGAGKLVNGPDLSFESQADNLRHLDTNGHGTFMAGLIAGRDPVSEPLALASPSAYLGMAPGARIVSLKVATADGGVDVTQVIAAINWVVQHKNDNGLNIRVLNLSFGTDSVQPYEVDPLAFAVEQAWKAGIFVVAATGNEGFVVRSGTLTMPALDPKIFAVGATDSMGTPLPTDDQVADFSSTGSTARYVDVVAPGAHLLGLRVPGSYVDEQFGATGKVDERYFRGSGTSQAAALVSGAAALAIQKHPTIDPDRLKKLFLENTVVLDGFSSLRQGRGEINLFTMLVDKVVSPPRAWNRIAWSSGTGSLDASRGSIRAWSEGVALAGERDIFSRPFNAAAMAALEASRSSWSGGTWNDSAWTGNSWSGNSWSGSSWSGSSWSGIRWADNAWSGNSWSGSSWSGSSWSGNSWSGSSWSGNSWSTGSWD